MQHIKQESKECWLASTCMLHPELDFEKLRATYPSGVYDPTKVWSKMVAPAMYPYVVKYGELYDTNPLLAITGNGQETIPPLSGEGLLYIVGGWLGHCVAYSNGWVHDPVKDKAMRPKKLIEIYPWAKWWHKQPKIAQKSH